MTKNSLEDKIEALESVADTHLDTIKAVMKRVSAIESLDRRGKSMHERVKALEVNKGAVGDKDWSREMNARHLGVIDRIDALENRLTQELSVISGHERMIGALERDLINMAKANEIMFRQLEEKVKAIDILEGHVTRLHTDRVGGGMKNRKTLNGDDLKKLRKVVEDGTDADGYVPQGL